MAATSLQQRLFDTLCLGSRQWEILEEIVLIVNLLLHFNLLVARRWYIALLEERVLAADVGVIASLRH